MIAHVEIDASTKDGLVPIKVDVVDWERFGRRSLSIGSHGYAQCWDGSRMTLLHREILGLITNDGRIGDHRNGDPFDCRRSNLRVVDASGSSQNVKGRGRSGYRNVYPMRDRWQAKIKFRGKIYHLGTYDTPEEADVVASAKRSELMPFAVDR